MDKSEGEEEALEEPGVLVMNSCCREYPRGRKGIRHYWSGKRPAGASFWQRMMVFWGVIKRKDKTPLIDYNYLIKDIKYLGSHHILVFLSSVNILGNSILYCYDSKENTPTELYNAPAGYAYHLIDRRCILIENPNDSSLEIAFMDAKQPAAKHEVACGLELKHLPSPVQRHKGSIYFVSSRFNVIVQVSLETQDPAFQDFNLLDLGLARNILDFSILQNCLYVLEEDFRLTSAELQTASIRARRPLEVKGEGIKASFASFADEIIVALKGAAETAFLFLSPELVETGRVTIAGCAELFCFFDHDGVMLLAVKLSGASENKLAVYHVANDSKAGPDLVTEITAESAIIKLNVVDGWLYVFTKKAILKVMLKEKVVFRESGLRAQHESSNVN
jgi:hypothetical protein